MTFYTLISIYTYILHLHLHLHYQHVDIIDIKWIDELLNKLLRND